jgi:two-component system cell cycle sensor histidine kinase/response regulator CckA
MDRIDALSEARRGASGTRPLLPDSYRSLFRCSPSLLLVLEPSQFLIVEVTEAYLRATMTSRDLIVGRCIFDVFPDNPDDTASDGARNLRASLERVRQTGKEDAMAVQRYPIHRPASQGGGFEERFWSPVNAPVLDDDGTVAFIIHRVEDVTPYVRARGSASSLRDVDVMEADTIARAQAVQALNLQLQERDRLLAIAGRVARIGGWLADLDSGIVHWSDEVCAIHEVPPGTTVTVAEGIRYYAPEWRSTITQRFNDCAQRGTPYDLELQILTASGRRVWVRSIGEAVRGPDGRISTVQGGFQDISASKAAMAEVTRLNERLTIALETMSDAFFAVDADFRFVYVNREAETALQRSRNDLLGKNLWDEFPMAVDTVFQREYTRAMRTGTSVAFEAEYPPLDLWVEVRAHPSDGGLAVYFHDITAEHERRRHVREQASLLDQANDAIQVRELDHTIVFWNKASERLFGWTADEAVGRKASELLFQHSPRALEAPTQLLLVRGEIRDEVEYVRKDGMAVVLDRYWTLVHDEKGAPYRILCINRDITEQRKLQSHLLRVQRMDSIGSLAGGIAHDLNNVLAPIVMSVDLLRLAAHSADTQATLSIIEECSQRGAKLVRQLLEFARGVEGARAPVKIDSVMTSVVRLVRELLPSSIRLEVSVPEGLWHVLGDPTQCHQVLLNLCINARDAMPDGGTISLTASNQLVDDAFAAMLPKATPGPHVRLVVTDTGHGIAPEIAERIFEPFFTTKEIGKGTGLGLSTVATIVSNHGGFVTVHSQLQQGTRFEVYLPAAQPDAVPERDAEVEELRRGHGELILVADDDNAVRIMLSQALEAYGYKVSAAEDGAEAVALLASSKVPVDAAIINLRMPLLDGTATVRALTRLQPGLRTILVSGVDARPDHALPAELGAAAWIAKPFTVPKLLQVLRLVIGEQRMRSGRPLQAHERRTPHP